MNPEDFIRTYEVALATQDWARVEPLVHDNACVTFSTGDVHKNKVEVGRAFRRNFSAIQDESYAITNIHWVYRNDSFAVYLFDFKWEGLIDCKPAAGSGHGTSVLVKEESHWLLMSEHLGSDA